MKNSEKVTVLVVMRNSISYIEKCLLSILKQDYPKDKMELILIDGLSDDGTEEYLNSFISKQSKSSLRIKKICNSKKTLATGWNLGIRHSNGDYICRIDAHSEIPSNYISTCINDFDKDNKIICVGGRINTVSTNPVIAGVLSSSFGVGNSKFRTSQVSGYVDTVAYGVYKKTVFDEYGLFNEIMDRNQDLEFHERIKSKYKIYMDTNLEILYHSRTTIKDVSKQAYRNGVWNLILFKKKPKALSLRHLVPLIFVGSIFSQIVLMIFFKIFMFLLIFEIALYFSLAAFAAIRLNSKIKYIFISILVFFVLHISYGIGSIIGIFRRINNV